MKLKNHILAGAAFALALAASFSPAEAQVSGANRVANYRLWAVKDATASQTFATTSYADLAAATTSFTPFADPNAIYAPGSFVPTDWIHVSFSMDVQKATATTGTCGIFVNGALLAKTARTVNSGAGQVAMNGDFYIPNTTTGTQTVKLQCKSGDTNVFTVNNAHMVVEEIF